MRAALSTSDVIEVIRLLHRLCHEIIRYYGVRHSAGHMLHGLKNQRASFLLIEIWWNLDTTVEIKPSVLSACLITFCSNIVCDSELKFQLPTKDKLKTTFDKVKDFFGDAKESFGKLTTLNLSESEESEGKTEEQGR